MRGTCHCGNVSFELLTHKDVAELVPRECSCTLCRMHRAIWISDPAGEAVVRYENPDLVSKYRFGHSTADFIICRECGALLAALCEIEGRTRAVLNIRTMPEEAFPAAPIMADFEGESVEERLSRRSKTWIGNVVFA